MKAPKTFSLLLILVAILNMVPCVIGIGDEGKMNAQQRHWQSLIYGDSLGAFTDIKQTTDSGYILLANRKSTSYSSPDHPTLVKLDKLGAVKWQIDCSAWQYDAEGGVEVQQTRDGGYIIAGGMGDIVKTDSAGKVMWVKSYGKAYDPPNNAPGEFCELYSIQQTTDDGYIVTGTTSNFGTKGGAHPLTGIQGTDIYLLKLNTAGNIQWSKTYGNEIWLEIGQYVRQTKDGGYIIAGQNEQPNVGQWVENSGFLIKTSATGAILWSRYYGTRSPYYISPITGEGEISGHFNSVEETSDGGYIATGAMGYYYGGMLVKLDSKGVVQWNKEYSINGGCGGFGRRAYQTSDGGYIMEGISGSCQNAQASLLFKVDASGTLQWNRNYGSLNDNGGNSFVVTKDRGYAMIGHTNDTIVEGYYSSRGFNYVIKTDSLGKDDKCQTTQIGVSYIPTIFADVYDITINTASLTTTNSYTSYSFNLTGITDICLSPPLKASFYINFNCVGDSTAFNNNSKGASYDATYSWNFGDNTTSTLTNPKHQYNTPGSYTVTLIATDASGSPTDDTAMTIQILNNKFITVSGNVTICLGDSTLLSASGSWASTGGYFSSGWQPIDSLRTSYSPSSYANPDSTIQYKATAYNGGCYDSDSLIVTVLPYVIPTIHGNTTICQGTSTSLSAIGANNYLWSTGETAISITISADSSTTYSVTSFNGLCKSSTSIKVTVLPTYTVNAGENITIDKGKMVVLNGFTGGTFNWYPSSSLSCKSCPNPEASPTITTTYYLTVENAGNKCQSTDSITVYVTNCEGGIFVSNVFTPNGDGKNDSLSISGSNCIQSIEFSVYDRWGEKVFESNSLSNPWDGNYKGKPLNKGVFVYYLKAILFTHDIIEKKGNISLIK